MINDKIMAGSRRLTVIILRMMAYGRNSALRLEFLLIGLRQASRRLTVITLRVTTYAAMAEWQTQWTQNPSPSKACGFKSRLRHFLRESFNEDSFFEFFLCYFTFFLLQLKRFRVKL